MANPITATRDYLMHSIAELKKVSWPSKEMTLRYSILVVAVSVATAVFFAALDFGLRTGVTAALANKPVMGEPLAPVVPDVEPTGIETSGGDVNVTPVPTETPASGVDAGGTITLPPIEIPQN